VTAQLLTVALLALTAADAGDGGAGTAADAGTDEAGAAADAPQPQAGGDAGAMGAPAPPEPRDPLDLQVFQLGTRSPVPGAALTVDVADSGETDARGRLATTLSCGPHHLVVQAPGFEPMSIVRDGCGGTNAPLVVRLVPRTGLAGYEAVVRNRTSRPVIALRGDEMTHTPGTMGDPFRVLESLPGVGTIAWPAPVYAVRGANPGNTGFVLDDLQVPALFHFALGPSIIHPYFFDGLDFFSGGAPARYGRFVSGLVSARTRAAPEDVPHASVDVRLVDAGAMVTAPLQGGGSVAVAGRYSYTGAIIGLVSSDITLAYWDYQLRADRRAGPFRLTLLAFGSSDRLSTSTSSDGISLQFHRLNLRGDAPLGGGVVFGSFGLGFDHSDVPLSELTSLRLLVNSWSALPRLAYSRASRHVDLEVGFDGVLQHYLPIGANRPGALDLGRERTARLLAGYVSLITRLGPRVILTPELRLDTYAISGAERSELGPRLSTRIAIDDRTWLRAVGGRLTQPPTLPLQIPGVDNFGLALFGLQTSWQGSLGFGTTRVPGVELEVTGFVQRYVLTDVRDPIPSASADPFAPDFLVRRDALATGLELLVRRPATERLHGWLSYTLSRSVRALGGGLIAPSDWDQRHILNLVVGYRVGRYTLGGRAHLNTGRPVFVEYAAGAQLQRLPTFYQIDLRVDRRILYDKFRLDVYVELVNATLSRQVTSLTQDAPNTAPRDDSFRVVLPSIGIHGEL
jgi:hypothetical protein